MWPSSTGSDGYYFLFRRKGAYCSYFLYFMDVLKRDPQTMIICYQLAHRLCLERLDNLLAFEADMLIYPIRLAREMF